MCSIPLQAMSLRGYSLAPHSPHTGEVNILVFTVLHTFFFFYPWLKNNNIYAATNSKQGSKSPENPLKIRLPCQHNCFTYSVILHETHLHYLLSIAFTILFVFIWRLTSVAGDKPHCVPFWLFNGHKQRGRAGHQDGHMTRRPRELWVKNKIAKMRTRVHDMETNLTRETHKQLFGPNNNGMIITQ